MGVGLLLRLLIDPGRQNDDVVSQRSDLRRAVGTAGPPRMPMINRKATPYPRQPPANRTPFRLPSRRLAQRFHRVDRLTLTRSASEGSSSCAPRLRVGLVSSRATQLSATHPAWPVAPTNRQRGSAWRAGGGRRKRAATSAAGGEWNEHEQTGGTRHQGRDARIVFAVGPQDRKRSAGSPTITRVERIWPCGVPSGRGRNKRKTEQSESRREGPKSRGREMRMCRPIVAGARVVLVFSGNNSARQ